MKYYIAIDNGVSGSISYIDEDKKDYAFFHIPTKIMFDYNKSGQKIRRIDHKELKSMIRLIKEKSSDQFCLVEKPFTMPKRYKASISAAKSLEAVLIVLEQLNIPYEIIGSSQWQKVMLKGIKGRENLKPASLQVGQKLFPKVMKVKTEDFDSLLMAEYGRRSKL